MMAPGEIAVAIALAWLATTVLFQFRPFSLRFQSLDRVGLLPRWLFFTQGAGTYVLAAQCRMRDAGGIPGTWEPLPLGTQWRWWHAVFHADHALAGFLWSAADRLARRAQRGDSAEVLAQTRAFATLRSHLARRYPGRDLQFMLLRSAEPGAPPEPVFVSEFIAT